MRRILFGPAHLWLVMSIVGTILGMEIDVMSGPLAPAALSCLLCTLDGADGTAADPGANPWVIFPTGLHPAQSSPVDANDLDEGANALCSADWPSPLNVIRIRKDELAVSSVALPPCALSRSPARSLQIQPRTSTSPLAGNLPVQLCRFVC